MTSEVVDYRLATLDSDLRELKASLEKMEQRVRALEIAWAKIMGMSAGGAIVGGALIQVIQYFTGK